MGSKYDSSMLNDFLPVYYKRLFPYKSYIQWIRLVKKDTTYFYWNCDINKTDQKLSISNNSREFSKFIDLYPTPWYGIKDRSERSERRPSYAVIVCYSCTKEDLKSMKLLFFCIKISCHSIGGLEINEIVFCLKILCDTVGILEIDEIVFFCIKILCYTI